MKELRDLEIPATTLEWTGKEDGDDAGYRNVATDPEVPGQTDPLELLTDAVEGFPVYHHGALPGVCPLYGEGIGAAKTMLVRRPMNTSLNEAATLLAQHNRRLLVLDAFRPAETQRRLFAYLFNEVTGGRDPLRMTAAEIIIAGKRADDIGSYVAVNQSTTSYRTATTARSSYGGVPLDDIARAAGVASTDEALELLLTFGANLGFEPTLELDATAPTAHGGGGAVDAILVDTETGKATCLGVPFDYIGSASMMRYFEDEGNLDAYAKLVEADPMLRTFLQYFGMTTITLEFFRAVQRERRLLFHAMMLAGATFYAGECWHWNLGNQHGGVKFSQFPFAGSGCHSLLKNVRDANGNWIAVWGNTYAQNETIGLK